MWIYLYKLPWWVRGKTNLPAIQETQVWPLISAGGCHGHAKAWPKGATPRPRSRAEAGRTPCPKGGGQEELPHFRGQGQRPRVPDCNCAGTAQRSYPTSEVGVGGGAAERRYPASEVTGGDEGSYPTSKVRGGGREEIPHALKPEARGGSQEDQPQAMAAPAQEGLEELSRIEGQEGRRWGDTPRPR